MPRLLLVLVLLSGCGGSGALEDVPPSGLEGAWQLVSGRAYDASGVLVYDPEVETGVLVIADGHYSFLWTRSPRPPAATPWAATEQERLTSFGTMIAHAGRLVRVAPDTLRADALAAKSPEFVGGHETFAVALEDGSLTLTAVWAEAGGGTPVPFYERGGRQDYVFVRR